MDWDNLSLVIVGLVVVFVVLILLIVLVWVFGKVMVAASNTRRGQESSSDDVSNAQANKPASAAKAAKDNAPRPAASAAAPAVEQGISGEVVAAISAAIMMLSEESGKTYAVRSIRRTKEARPAWAMAGILENTKPF